MKIILLFIALVSLGNFATAQKWCSEKNVPTAVKTKFTNLYPDVKMTKWKKEGTEYRACFEKDKMRRKATFSSTGELKSTSVEIEKAQLPQKAVDFMEKNYPDKKIEEVSKGTDVAGNTSFEAEVAENILVFDKNGGLVKSMKEEKEKMGDEKEK